MVVVTPSSMEQTSRYSLTQGRDMRMIRGDFRPHLSFTLGNEIKVFSCFLLLATVSIKGSDDDENNFNSDNDDGDNDDQNNNDTGNYGTDFIDRVGLLFCLFVLYCFLYGQ